MNKQMMTELLGAVGKYALIKGKAWRMGDGLEIMEAYQALSEDHARKIVEGEESTLRESADRLRYAGHDFWTACQKEAGGGAVRWIDFSDGTLIIFTRGEYRDALLSGVDKIPGIPVVRFQLEGGEESNSVSAIEHV